MNQPPDSTNDARKNSTDQEKVIGAPQGPQSELAAEHPIQPKPAEQPVEATSIQKSSNWTNQTGEPEKVEEGPFEADRDKERVGDPEGKFEGWDRDGHFIPLHN